MKRTFLQLTKLTDITFEGETAAQHADFVARVKDECGDNAYTLDIDNEVSADFAADELEFVDTITCWQIMGGMLGTTDRFYVTDWVAVRDKATGKYWALYSDDIYDV